MALYPPQRQPSVNVNEIGYASHDYDAATADWTLNKSEQKCLFLVCTNAGGGVNINAPLKVGKTFIVRNASGQNVTILVAGATGITIANGKTAQVICGTSDYLRVTGDQTH